MKVLAFGDVHLRERGSFKPFNLIGSSGMTLEIENILKGAHWLSELIKVEKPELVVFLGDFYHINDTISNMTLNAAGIFMEIVRNACFEVGSLYYGLVGNHDMLSEKCQINSLRPLKAYFDRLIITHDIINIKGTKMGFMSYTSSNSEVNVTFSTMRDCEVVFTHLPFNGAMMESGKVSDCGNANDTQLKMVISGHEHVQQKIRNIIYPGSLSSHRFCMTDYNQFGGAVVYDTESKSHKFYKNNYSSHYIVINSLDMIRMLPDNLKFVLQIRSELPKNDIIQELSNTEFLYDIINTAPKSKRTSMNYNYVESSKINPVETLKIFVKDNNYQAYSVLEDIGLRE